MEGITTNKKVESDYICRRSFGSVLFFLVILFFLKNTFRRFA